MLNILGKNVNNVEECVKKYSCQRLTVSFHGVPVFASCYNRSQCYFFKLSQKYDNSSTKSFVVTND